MAQDEVYRLGRIRREARSGIARTRRQEAGVTLRQLARVMGVPPSTLSRWETGRSLPRLDAALAWSAALDALEGAAP